MLLVSRSNRSPEGIFLLKCDSFLTTNILNFSIYGNLVSPFKENGHFCLPQKNKTLAFMLKNFFTVDIIDEEYLETQKTRPTVVHFCHCFGINQPVPCCCTEILWNNSGCVFVVLQERLEINIVILLMASLKTWTIITVTIFPLNSNCNPFFLFGFLYFISWFPASRKNRLIIFYTSLLCFRQLSSDTEVKYISENWLPSVGTNYVHSPERKMFLIFCLLQPSDSAFHHFPSE